MNFLSSGSGTSETTPSWLINANAFCKESDVSISSTDSVPNSSSNDFFFNAIFSERLYGVYRGDKLIKEFDAVQLK